MAQAMELIGDRAGAEEVLVARYVRQRDVVGAVPDRLALGAAAELAGFYCDDGRWDEAADCISTPLAWPRAGLLPGVGGGAPRRPGATCRTRGRHAEALALAEHAVELVEPTENLDFKARVTRWLSPRCSEQTAGRRQPKRPSMRRSGSSRSAETSRPSPVCGARRRPGTAGLVSVLRSTGRRSASGGSSRR